MPVADRNVAVSPVDVAAAVPAADCTSCGPADGAFTVRTTVFVRVALGPVAVTTMFEVPLGVPAPVAMVIVEVCPAVIVAGLKLTVVAAGWPLAVSAALCALPLVTAVLIVLVVDWPAVTLTGLGAAVIEKSSDTGALTVRTTGFVRVALGPVAVTTMFEVPLGVPAPVAMVIVEVCPAVIVAGLKLTVVAAGWPLAVSATLCALPLVTAVLIVLVVDWPAVTLTGLGAAVIEKSSPEDGVVTFVLDRVDWLPTASKAVTW